MKERCYFYRASVLKVTDGDTIVADVDVGFGFKTSKTKIRLSGIDAGETRSKDLIIKEKGERAKEWLRSLVEGKEIYVESQGIDKYGRVLGRIFTLDGSCCNDELIRLGLALTYDGGTKKQELLKG
jgi:micrococcal nuclease